MIHWVQRLRIPLHVAVYLLSTAQFAHHCRLRNMFICSKMVEGGVAIEHLAAYLLWLAM